MQLRIYDFLNNLTRSLWSSIDPRVKGEACGGTSSHASMDFRIQHAQTIDLARDEKALFVSIRVRSHQLPGCRVKGQGFGIVYSSQPGSNRLECATSANSSVVTSGIGTLEGWSHTRAHQPSSHFLVRVLWKWST